MSVQRQIDRLIALRAAEWYELLRNDGADETRRHEFVDWVSESPRHMEAFMSVASGASFIRRALAGSDLQNLPLSQGPRVLAMPDVAVLPSAAGDDTGGQAPPEERAQTRTRGRLWGIAAAIGVLAAGIGISMAVYLARPQSEIFETRIGEQRTLQLAEGSVVNLNTGSRIEVRLRASRRDVRLERGEATFKVARDADRPFRVHAQDSIVEAVGTQFNVYARQDGATSVAVLEGKVEISNAAPASLEQEALVPLAAGEAAVVRPDGRIERESGIDVSETIAWQRRVLIFKRTALADIASEFNRYNQTTRFRLKDIDPGTLHFTGVFSADDPQSLADLLAREPDLHVERRNDEIVVRLAGRQ